MGRIKTFFRSKKWKAWLGYWSEPEMTSRKFVLGVALLCAVPYFGVWAFLLFLLYAFFNSLDAVKKIKLKLTKKKS